MPTPAPEILVPSETPPAHSGSERSKYVAEDLTFGSITEQISSIVLTPRTSPGWFAIFGFGGALLILFTVVIIYLLVEGVGIWGIDIPVAWGFAITNFVWWIGIGH